MRLAWFPAPRIEGFASNPTLADQIIQLWDAFLAAILTDWKALVIFMLLGAVIFFGAIWWLDFRQGRERTKRADNTSKGYADLGLSATRDVNIILQNQVEGLQSAMTRLEADYRRRERQLQEEIRDLQKSHADRMNAVQRDQSEMRETIRSIQHSSEECHQRERVYVATFGIIRKRLDPEAAADVEAMLNTLENATATEFRPTDPGPGAGV